MEQYFKELGFEKMDGNGAEVYARGLLNNTSLVLTKDVEGNWYYSDDYKKVIVKDLGELKNIVLQKQKMFTIYQSVPNYVDAKGKKASFNSKEDLFEIPFVKSWMEREGHVFNNFSLSVTKIMREENKFQYVLMAIYDDNDYWWPVGYIEPDPIELNLPLWELKKEQV